MSVIGVGLALFLRNGRSAPAGEAPAALPD
jgi:hypothetical protein